MQCVLEALAALHDANVVYGDVKPSNFVRTKVRMRYIRLVAPRIAASQHASTAAHPVSCYHSRMLMQCWALCRFTS